MSVEMIGPIANNRFLQRTNPIMTAAVADGGSIITNNNIQLAARQMVDMGIYSNLKLWVDPDLPKLRNSGGVDYIPKLYDLSGNANNPAQATEANQPKIDGTYMMFNGYKFIPFTYPTFTDKITITAYFRTDSYGDSSTRNNFIFYFWWSNSPTKVMQLFQRGTTYKMAWRTETVNGERVANSNTVINPAETVFVAATYDGANNKLYINASDETTESVTTGYGNLSTSPLVTQIAQPISAFIGSSSLADLRIFNIALTGDQITAIYNQTSYRYA